MSKKSKIVAIVGPTASGKTGLSIEIAKALDGEIICCDSMQIYDEMMIGTARPTEEEMQGVPHHLFGIISPKTSFSCADYVPLARAKIDEILGRGKTPILCGGTGLYLDSVLYQQSYSPSISPEIREQVKLYSDDEAYDKLKEFDPQAAENIHKNNRKRVNRALEICIGTGKTKTEWDSLTRVEESLYDCKIVFINYADRDKLYERIDRRVDLMFEQGLENEVKGIDFGGKTTASEAIGYKEIVDYFDGKCTLDEAKEQIKQSTRRYAKRQITWFKREKNMMQFCPDTENCDNLQKNILNYLTNE